MRRWHALAAPDVIRLVASLAAAVLAGVVAFTGTAGVVDSMPLAAVAGLVAAGVTAAWTLALPIREAASRAPLAIRVVFLAGTVLVGVQLAWLVPFIIDPGRSEWESGPWAPMFSRHSCVSSYWVADQAISTTPDVYSERLYSVPQADPTMRRVARRLGPLNIDQYEYPPTFLLLPRLLAHATPDFWGFRRLWFALNLAVVVAIAIALARRVDVALGTHAVWLTPFVIAAPPIISTFQVGNVQLAVVAVSAFAMLLFERRAHAVGGLLLAYVTAGKIFPGMLVVYLLLRRDWRAVAWTAGFGAGIVAVSLGVYGWPVFAEFIGHAPKLLSGEAFPAFRNPVAIGLNQSVPGLVFKLGLFGVPHMGFPAMRLVGWLYTLVCVGGVAWLALRARPEGREPLVWLAILVLATMRSPFLPTYAGFPSMWLLTFVAALAWKGARPVAPAVIGWCALALVWGGGGGAGGWLSPRWNAAWSTIQTAIAFGLLTIVFRQLRTPGR